MWQGTPSVPVDRWASPALRLWAGTAKPEATGSKRWARSPGFLGSGWQEVWGPGTASPARPCRASSGTSPSALWAGCCRAGSSRWEINQGPSPHGPAWGPVHISSEQAALRAEGLFPRQVKAAQVTLPGRKMQSCLTSYDWAPEVVQRHHCHMFLMHTRHQPNHIQEKGIETASWWKRGKALKEPLEQELLLLSSLESMACHRVLISNHGSQRYLGDE